LTKNDLLLWKEELRVTRELAPATVNRRLAALAAFLKFAQSPIGVPKNVRRVKRGPKWLERNQKNFLLRVIAKAGNPLHLAIVTILLKTGLRVSELCKLKWSNIKIGERSGELTISGKGRKERIVELEKEARKALQSLGYEEYKGQNRHAIYNRNGKPITVRGVQWIAEHYGPRAELPHLTIHSLRHTFAHDALESGMSLHLLSQLMGHESINTTAGYVTPSQAERQAAVDRLSAEPSEPDDDDRPQRRPAERSRY
jgi:integrase/recombinase XerC